MYLNAQINLVDDVLQREIGPHHFLNLPPESEGERMTNVWMGTGGKSIISNKIKITISY